MSVFAFYQFGGIRDSTTTGPVTLIRKFRSADNAHDIMMNRKIITHFKRENAKDHVVFKKSTLRTETLLFRPNLVYA